jgi:cyclic pyranopterin monophosphate synthase
MVDVGDKASTDARSGGAGHGAHVGNRPDRLVRSRRDEEGRRACRRRGWPGIMAAKRTSDLIPLCHPLPLTHVSVELTPTRGGFTIEGRARTTGQTGVEMEALTAVAVAGADLYDMVKAVDKAMVIGDIRLIEKRGGQVRHFRA